MAAAAAAVVLTAATPALGAREREVQRSVTAIPHLALWLCIHAEEGAWYDDTGNGFYGGLQMTWNWGHGIVGNPNAYTPRQIMWAAEAGFRGSGYSIEWLEQQWPETSPPCLRYA